MFWGERTDRHLPEHALAFFNDSNLIPSRVRLPLHCDSIDCREDCTSDELMTSPTEADIIGWARATGNDRLLNPFVNLFNEVRGEFGDYAVDVMRHLLAHRQFSPLSYLDAGQAGIAKAARRVKQRLNKFDAVTDRVEGCFRMIVMFDLKKLQQPNRRVVAPVDEDVPLLRWLDNTIRLTFPGWHRPGEVLVGPPDAPWRITTRRHTGMTAAEAAWQLSVGRFMAFMDNVTIEVVYQRAIVGASADPGPTSVHVRFVDCIL